MIPISKTLQLAQEKKLDNATAVKRQDGIIFLRGVGIELGSLPIVYKQQQNR
jgi:hypothetical protein